MEQAPPMDMPQDMGNGDMGGDFMPQGDMMQQPPMDAMGMGGNEFDTNFDPGVEADEEQDPKKFIQQLTGKLSQSLKNYTDNNGQPDVDLNKYVAGMITKQAMKGLTPEDADEIIDKVKADEEFTMDGGEGQQDMQPMDNQMMADPNQQQMPQQPNESFRRNNKRNLEEIVNGVLDDYKSEDMYKQVTDKEHYNKKPFMSKNFK